MHRDHAREIVFARIRAAAAILTLVLCVGAADVIHYRKSVLVYSSGLPSAEETYWIVLEKRWEWLPGEFQIHREISRSKFEKLHRSEIVRERTRWYENTSPERYDTLYMEWALPHGKRRLRSALKARGFQAIVSSVGRSIWVDGAPHVLRYCDEVLAEFSWEPEAGK